MASWQPPIPSGALYSRPARDLGPALALLAWCYDAVQRDGCFDVQLKEVAHEMDEPYHTVVKWWAKLQNGSFFVNVTDRGRSGFRVQFHDDWIDWRILNARGTKAMNRFELPEMVIEEDRQPSITAQKLFNDSSITAELPEMVIETGMYKEDKSQESRVKDVAANAATAQSDKKPRKPKTEPQSPIEVRRIVAIGSQIDLATGLKSDCIQVAKVAGDLWHKMHKPEQPVDSFVSDIRNCGKWIRQTQHPYKGSQQRIPPSALIKFWPAWVASLVHANGTNGYAPIPADDPDVEYISAEEMRAAMPSFIRAGGAK